jgi:segregation and condensation protein B
VSQVERDPAEDESQDQPESHASPEEGISTAEEDLELRDDELGEGYDEDEGETIGESLESLDASEPGGLALATPKARLLEAMRLEAKVEAVIFASQKPLKVAEIVEILGDATIKEDDVQATLDHLVDFYEGRNGGFKLHYLKRLGYQFQTVQDAGAVMERMFATRPRPISRAALETLTIIAYRQPVTRAEVEFIRGVDTGSIFKTLLERSLVRCVGRKEVVGRPMLFGTTDEFLKVFNLSSIKDLPPLEAFQPSRETMQGAMSKIDGEEGPVDIEQYIADNTAELEGATLADDAEFGDGDADAEAEAKPQAAREEAEEEETDTDHGTAAFTEMDSPIGTGLPPRGGDLDL